MTALIVKVPAKHRNGSPAKPLQVHSVWQMPDDKIGIWVGEPGPGQRWPITGLTREQVLSWQAALARRLETQP